MNIQKTISHPNHHEFELWVYTKEANGSYDLDDMFDMNGNFKIALRKVKEHMRAVKVDDFFVDLRWKEVDDDRDFFQETVYRSK